MINLRLKELRKMQNVTQKQVATAIKTTERHYQNLEYGKVKPSHDTTIALANYFNVSADFLLCLSNDPKRH